jgi:hypothetical protein
VEVSKPDFFTFFTEAEAFIRGVEYVNDSAVRPGPPKFVEGTWMVEIEDGDASD